MPNIGGRLICVSLGLGLLLPAAQAGADEYQPLVSHQSSGVAVTYPSHRPACPTRVLATTTLTLADNVPLVTLDANDHTLTLILDTGAQTTVLTRVAAQRIAAQPLTPMPTHELHGIGGTIPATEIELHSLNAGGTPLAAHRALMADIPAPTLNSQPIDGLLGADSVATFDVDLDPTRQRLTLFQPQQCADPSPPWPTPEWPSAPAIIAARRSAAGDLLFPVELDGRVFTALIDTGAQYTALSTAAAASMGLGVGTLAAGHPVIATGAAGERLPSNVLRFRSLTIAGRDIPNPLVTVTNLSIGDADLILGMDFVATRHVWLSYAARRLAIAMI